MHTTTKKPATNDRRTFFSNTSAPSGDAYKEFLYKGEPIGLIVRRLKELREAKLDKDQGLLLSLRDSGWQNPYADNWY